MRGHGLSDAPEGDYFMGDLVADAAALMEATGFRDAVFVGLSIGGVVAQGLAAERPDLVRAAVLSNTAAKIGTEESWRERIATVRAGGIEAIADGVMEKWFTGRFHAERAEELALWRHMLTRTPVDGYLGCCAAIAGTDLRESTAGLRQPVLALVGDADGSTPPDLVRETAESIAGRALRDRPRRRPHPLRRAAGGDGAADRRLPEGDGPCLTATHAGWRRAARCSATPMSTAPRRRRPPSTRRSRSSSPRAPGARSGRGPTSPARAVADHAGAARRARPVGRGGDARARHRQHRREPGDVREAMLHVAVYAGVPAANHALKIIKETYREMGVEP